MADWAGVFARAEVVVFHDHVADIDQLVSRLDAFDAICTMRERTPFKRELLERLPNLKLLATTGARNASIDGPAAKERGIVVSGTGYVGHGAAELTWALILAAAKHIPYEHESLRAGGWQTSIGMDLKGSVLGVLGLGNLGGRIARYAQAFELEVIAWSPNLSAEKATAAGARLVSKNELFTQSDFLTIHMVLSDRSRGIVSGEDLAQMKRTAWLVNTSRGPLVDEPALIEALQNRKIAGAALDVFDMEPLPSDHPFRSLPNVVLTPHMGYVTEQTYRLFFRDTVENILAWLDGKPVRVVN